MGKLQLVNGTVTLSFKSPGTDKSIGDADRVLQKAGVYGKLLPRENKMILKGKNINTDQLVSDLQMAGFSVEVVKIETDLNTKPKPKVALFQSFHAIPDDLILSHQHTIHFKVEELCCESNALLDRLKSKLERTKGVEEVTVDLKLKKVTVKGNVENKEVLEAAAQVVAVKIWAD